MSEAPTPRPSGNPVAQSLQRMGTIAWTTTREALRNRVLFVLVAFAVGLMAFSVVLGQLSLHEETRVMKDLGLAGISLVSLIIALFLGVNLLSKELDKKTVYAILPKPIHRWEFLLGKYGGLALTMTLLVTAMSAVLAIFVLGIGGHLGVVMIRAEVLILFELLLVVAVATFFSSFSSPYLSAMFAGALWIIGRNSPTLESFAMGEAAADTVGPFLLAVTRVLPDFHKFYVSGANLGGEGIVSVHETFVSWGYVATAGAYCLLYSAALLTVAAVLFSRRDLT